jgi:hypothetical protein
MKKTKDGAKPFMVPLTDAMLGMLNARPRFSSGYFVFSNSFDKDPLKRGNFSDIKKRLDALMLKELYKLAVVDGKDSERVTLPHFVNQDIRRTVRTADALERSAAFDLSALRIGEEVREAVLAHVRPGINGVYDKHQRVDEKRDALTPWSARLCSIVGPPPTNLIQA